MTWVELIAVIFGVLCVWLTVRQNIWCWPTGLVQVLLFIYVFYQVRLYSDVLLHIVYVGLSLYGWYHWLHGGKHSGLLKVTRLSARARATWVGISVVGTIFWGLGMASFTNAAVPFPDAFTTVTSLVAQLLMARKRLESWLFWIAVDVVAIGVYINRELFLTAGLYAIFLVLAVMGFMAWRRTHEAETTTGASDENRADPREVRASSPRTPSPH